MNQDTIFNFILGVVMGMTLSALAFKYEVTHQTPTFKESQSK